LPAFDGFDFDEADLESSHKAASGADPFLAMQRLHQQGA
jgi:hypothetical protein